MLKKIFFKSCLLILLTLLYACSFYKDQFEPPSKKQAEKQYIKKTAEPPAQEVKPAEICPIVLEISPENTLSLAKHRNISKVVLNNVQANGFLADINFVTRWNILGPFFYEAENLADDKIKELFHNKLIVNEKKLRGNEKTLAPAKWQLARFEFPQKPGEINLRDFFKDKRDHLVAYAVTYLQCDKELSNLSLYMGSSGYIKVWINHQLVHVYDQDKRRGKWDQDVIKNIKLRRGYNLVVVKCLALETDWSFYLRLADAENLPLKFVPVTNIKKIKK